MKLSVITINLDNKQGLQQTIESVVYQTFGDLELIVIDGKSADGSIDVIRQYEDKIAYWVSEPDEGIYNAMNKGIKHSNGDYLYFLNSGDTLASGMVFDAVFADAPDTAFICGNFITDYKGTHVNIAPYRNRNWQQALYDIYSGDLCHQAFFIRKDMFIRYGLYDERLKITADWKLFFVAIGIHQEAVLYRDTDIVIYNLEGLSSTIGGKVIHDERRLVAGEELPGDISARLERLYFLEQNSYITDIVRSRKWIFNCFRAFCKIGRMLGFIKS